MAAQRNSGGKNALGNAFAAAGNSIMQTAQTSMPSYAQHVADTVEIAANPRNKRVIDPESDEIQGLARSLLANGQMQAIAVVPRVEFLAWEGFERFREEIGDARYIVIGGGRRLAAGRVAKFPRMDISIKTGLTREQFLRLTLIENIDRKDLRPLEEARQIQELRDETGDSYAQIGEQLEGRTKGWVGQRLDLLKLSPQLQTELDSDAKGSMNLTQARTLLKRIRDEIGEDDDATMPADRQWQLWEELRAEPAPERLRGKRSTDPPVAEAAVHGERPVAVEPVQPVAPFEPEAEAERLRGKRSSPSEGLESAGVAGSSAPVPTFSSPKPNPASATPPGSVIAPAFSSSDAPAPRPRRATTAGQPDEAEPTADPKEVEDPWDEVVWETVDPVSYARLLHNRMPAEKWATFVVEVNAQ
jgi:ParB/RepB/Spo0J family partition protein